MLVERFSIMVIKSIAQPKFSEKEKSLDIFKNIFENFNFFSATWASVLLNLAWKARNKFLHSYFVAFSSIL